MSRRLGASWALALLLVIPVVIPANGAAAFDEQYEMAFPAESVDKVAYRGFLAEAIPMPKMTPMLFALEASGTDFEKSVVTDVGLCESMNDQRCRDAENVTFEALLPECTATLTIDCIEEITAIGSSGQRLEVDVTDRFVIPGFDHAADANLRLPAGREGLLFTVTGVSHPGGNLFMAYAYTSGNRLSTESVFTTNFFRMRIAAVKLIEKPGSPPVAIIAPEFFRGKSIGQRSATGNYGDCVLLTKTVCAQNYPLPLEIKLGMAVRVSNPISGWLHGRFGEPNAEVSLIGGGQRIKLEAAPVRVPTAATWIKQVDLPEDLKTFYASMGNLGGTGYGCIFDEASKCVGSESVRSLLRSVDPNEPSMREFLLWLKYMGDRAVAVPSVWLVQSTERGGGPDSSCYSDPSKLSGIVMTNATSYIAGPPTFNKQTQTLDYKVAAPHFLPDGKTPFLGTYDLLMRSDVARCLYGFSNAPISATVSVVSENGQNQVATTVVNEKDGWLTLRAAGFGFSSPTVRVQLTQKTPAAAKPLGKKSTITCVKGKTLKKVSAINPKCPAGFRKK